MKCSGKCRNRWPWFTGLLLVGLLPLFIMLHMSGKTLPLDRLETIIIYISLILIMIVGAFTVGYRNDSFDIPILTNSLPVVWVMHMSGLLPVLSETSRLPDIYCILVGMTFLGLLVIFAFRKFKTGGVSLILPFPTIVFPYLTGDLFVPYDQARIIFYVLVSCVAFGVMLLLMDERKKEEKENAIH